MGFTPNSTPPYPLPPHPQLSWLLPAHLLPEGDEKETETGGPALCFVF